MLANRRIDWGCEDFALLTEPDRSIYSPLSRYFPREHNIMVLGFARGFPQVWTAVWEPGWGAEEWFSCRRW